ncbi:putative fimbrial chaperone protein YehC [Pseudescherichia vulneris NBRC 102420]|uniref:Putative fimbrial chaperone protein YehC n=1 Tax=Pseudescherichia vulneris NBRC 102420 TaxID=1115515 RepID=A0A090VTZ7_PSEVU|nr:fimbria/pilus periplasmic chaperone [Pseudescherichia vulneris]GAL58657.1 putative fimbrial chaperone protein YehC [Pseudescherichia vulneris NBRC 102420]
MKRILAALLALTALPAWSGVYIYGTRVIYPAAQKEVTVQLMNQGERSALVQAWIDDGDTQTPPEKLQVPFLLTPPVVKVKGNTGQQLKIKFIKANLPQDRESLYYLNVLDIPPNDASGAETNQLKFALQNRIKLIFRPTSVAGINKETFSKIHITRASNGLTVENTSANWLTIPEIKSTVKANKDTLLLAPHANVNLPGAPAANQYAVTLIDDYGNYLLENIKSN